MIVVKQAGLEQLNGLSKLFDAYRVFYKKSSDILAASNFLSERIRNNESVIFIAEEDGVSLGFVQLYPMFSSTNMKRMWLLNDLYVAENQRGKGISKLLMERAKDLAISTEAIGLMLETDKGNVIGNNLYPKVGFELDTDHNFYYWSPKES